MPDDESRPWRWYWGYGSQPEVYQGNVATRDEAIAAAMTAAAAEDDRCLDCMTIACARPMKLADDCFDADNVLDTWHDQNEDAADEDGELSMKPSHQQKQELERALEAAFTAWRTRHVLGQAWSLEFRSEEVVEVPPRAGQAEGRNP